MITYIHYGADIYNSSLAVPVRNAAQSSKPAEGTGFWGSREGTTYENGRISYGWKEWCQDTKYRVEKLKRSFRFRLSDPAKLLLIEKPEDLVPLPKLAPWKLKDMSALKKLPAGEFPTLEQLHGFYSPNPCYPDFEQLLKDGIDAVELRNSHLFSRYLVTWDYDCILVLNPDVIVPVMKDLDHALMKPVK